MQNEQQEQYILGYVMIEMTDNTGVDVGGEFQAREKCHAGCAHDDGLCFYDFYHIRVVYLLA